MFLLNQIQQYNQNKEDYTDKMSDYLSNHDTDDVEVILEIDYKQ